MKIIALKETADHEKRVSLTPEVAKKLIDLGHSVVIEKGAGIEAGIADNDYEAAGATLTSNASQSLGEVDVVTHVAPLSGKEAKALKANSVLISLMKPHQNGELLDQLAASKVTSISLEMIPRISRAQSMDVLSSQSNLAGYKAVIDAVAEYGRAIPLMMTAAGTIPPAKILIIGAGVAGLQAIATARRLGAIVSAFDVRAAAKEQVESLGAVFVEVPSEESGDSSGGYAKEMSEAYKKRQAERLAEVIQKQDIIITTALIPGKPAPVLITKKMVESMRPGSIIVDLAVENGGNCELAAFGKTVDVKGVKIIGYPNVPSRLAFDASQLFARNILSFLKTITAKDSPKLSLDFEDEIVKGSCLTHAGKIVHPAFEKGISKVEKKIEKTPKASEPEAESTKTLKSPSPKKVPAEKGPLGKSPEKEKKTKAAPTKAKSAKASKPQSEEKKGK